MDHHHETTSPGTRSHHSTTSPPLNAQQGPTRPPDCMMRIAQFPPSAPALSGLSAVALSALRLQQDQGFQPGPYGDSRSEAMELRVLLEQAKNTIQNLHGMLLRYEEENGRLRRYVEELTRTQDGGRVAGGPRIDDYMRMNPTTYLPPPSSPSQGPPIDQHLRSTASLSSSGDSVPTILTRPPLVAEQARSFASGTSSETVRPGGVPRDGLAAVLPTSSNDSSNPDYSSGSEKNSYASSVDRPPPGMRKRQRHHHGHHHADKQLQSGAGGGGGFHSRDSGSVEDVLDHDNGQGGGDKKYRKSCDFCTTTKIRCDGVKPSCDNCAKRGIKCNYSERKRPGPKITGSTVSSDNLSSRPRHSTVKGQFQHHGVQSGSPGFDAGNGGGGAGAGYQQLLTQQQFRLPGEHADAAAILMKMPGVGRPRQPMAPFALPTGSGTYISSPPPSAGTPRAPWPPTFTASHHHHEGAPTHHSSSSTAPAGGGNGGGGGGGAGLYNKRPHAPEGAYDYQGRL